MKIRFFIVIAIPLFFLDQLTKYLVTLYLPPYGTLAVIDGFFNLTLVYNTGTAFGLFKEGRYFLIGITFVLIIALMLFFWKSRKNIWDTLCLSLILGGASGNLADRILKGYVIDFLDFYVGSYHWYTFNIADSAITVGVTMLFIIYLFRSKEVQ